MPKIYTEMKFLNKELHKVKMQLRVISNKSNENTKPEKSILILRLGELEENKLRLLDVWNKRDKSEANRLKISTKMAKKQGYSKIDKRLEGWVCSAKKAYYENLSRPDEVLCSDGKVRTRKTAEAFRISDGARILEEKNKEIKLKNGERSRREKVMRKVKNIR